MRLLDDQLAPGETILWTRAPNRDRLLMRIDYLLVPVGFVIGVVAAAAVVAAIIAIFNGDGAAAFIGLIVGLAAGAAALYIVFGRFIKRFRQALVEANYNLITVRWKLSIVRRFYDAACNAGLRPDNPVAGVRSPRVHQAAEDFMMDVN